LSPESSKNTHTPNGTLQDAGVLSPDLEHSKKIHILGRGGSLSQPFTFVEDSGAQFVHTGLQKGEAQIPSGSPFYETTNKNNHHQNKIIINKISYHHQQNVISSSQSSSTKPKINCKK